jgi:hypothetical protein
MKKTVCKTPNSEVIGVRSGSYATVYFLFSLLNLN